MAGTRDLLEKLIQATERLRGVSESLLLTQKALVGDMAEMSAAVVEHTNGTAILADAVLTATSRLGAALDRLEDLEARFGRYVQDTAKQESGIRQVDARLKDLEARVGERK